MESPVILSREQTRRVDRIAIDEYGISGLVLMENAGRGVVDALLDVDPSLASQGRVAILCGKGNNAGDGFVIARHLGIRGVAARVVLLCPPDQLTGDARANYDVLVRAGADVVFTSPDSLDGVAGGATWLVDALLGTGAAGPPREPFRTAIEWMNAQPARRLAVDIPSGLDCDTGKAAGVAVRADLTCTFIAAKPGLVRPEAASLVGELRVISIGVPPCVIQQAARE
jgi:NAD(P)H-hydrate epimerase